MRVLLDECIDRRLAQELTGHSVRTVPQAGWAGVKNVKLLALAQDEFDVFITVDRNLAYQQDLSRFRIAVVVLHAVSNQIEDLLPLLPSILSALSRSKPGRVIDVGELRK